MFCYQTDLDSYRTRVRGQGSGVRGQRSSPNPTPPFDPKGEMIPGPAMSNSRSYADGNIVDHASWLMQPAFIYRVEDILTSTYVYELL